MLWPLFHGLCCPLSWCYVPADVLRNRGSDGGANTTASGGYWHVPKRDLVHAGIVAFQNGTRRVGKLRYRSVLEEELKNYRLKQNIATGYAGFAPLREGQHDDLLFVTCLGVWAWEHAIEKQEYIAFRGECELEGVPVNVVGKLR